MTTTRRPRADARRNYERLLTAADTAFTTHGTDASLESIARTAGVAIGTLYGHFPTRRALISALLQDRNTTLFELGDQLITENTPNALTTWTRAVTEHAATYSGLASLLAGGLNDEASELHTACQRMADTANRLVTLAHTAGTLRPDATGEDIQALTIAAAALHQDLSAAAADRLITLTLDGLANTT